MIRRGKPTTDGFAFWCPGCERPHVIRTGPNGWIWNGSSETPTIQPSVKVTYRHPEGYSNDNPAPLGYDGPYVEDICHTFVTDGRIQFLGDCTHALVGQTVDLPEWPYD